MPPSMRIALCIFAITVGVLIGLFVMPTPAATPAPTIPSPVLIAVEGGHGSGVHIGHGLYVTAAHVASAASDGHLRVKLADGEYAQGDVLWVNKDYDLALIRTNPDPRVAAAPLVCSAPELAPGVPVQAIGNPLNLEKIHTWGHVSRSTFKRDDSPRFAFIADLTIAPGNSGGPVFDAQGNLAGIVVAMAAAPVGMSASLLPLTYVVPSSALCTLLGRAA